MGYDYYTFTGTQGEGYYEPPAALAQSGTSLTLLSKTYGAETELGIGVFNLTKPITSTMTSFTN